jgi:hypothetical protein
MAQTAAAAITAPATPDARVQLGRAMVDAVDSMVVVIAMSVLLRRSVDATAMAAEAFVR